jgi:hypothetical protein
MLAAVGTEPPEPRLITLPARRVCACGKILRPHERAQECCDVCLVFNRHLPQLPVVPAAPALS